MRLAAVMLVLCSCGKSNPGEARAEVAKREAGDCSRWTDRFAKKLAAAQNRRASFDIDALDVPVVQNVEGSAGVGPLVVVTPTNYEYANKAIRIGELRRALVEAGVDSCERPLFNDKPACKSFLTALQKDSSLSPETKRRVRYIRRMSEPPSELERAIASDPALQDSAQRIADSVKLPEPPPLPATIRRPATPKRPAMYIAADRHVPVTRISRLKEVVPELYDLRLLVHRPDDRGQFDFDRKRSAAAESWRGTYNTAKSPSEKAVATSKASEAAVWGCTAVIKLFGDVASVAGWAKSQYIAIELPRKIRDCQCRGVDLDLLELSFLAIFDADKRPSGWIRLPKTLPAVSTVEKLATDLAKR